MPFFRWAKNLKKIEILMQYFPILRWAPNYNVHFFVADLIAGLTVGCMVVPQSLAYALSAGLPGIYGLYSSFMCLFVYCIFGTSKDLSVGPTAIMSLLVYQYLADSSGKSDPAHAIALTFFAGIIQLCMGMCRLGIIVDLISIPVINGFTTSSAIVIGMGQVKVLLTFIYSVYISIQIINFYRTACY